MYGVVVPVADQAEVREIRRAALAPVNEVMRLRRGGRAIAVREDAATVADHQSQPLLPADDASGSAHRQGNAIGVEVDCGHVGVAGDAADGGGGEVFAGGGDPEAFAVEQGLFGDGDDQVRAGAAGTRQVAVPQDLRDQVDQGVGAADRGPAGVGFSVEAGSGCRQRFECGLQQCHLLVGVGPLQSGGPVPVRSQVRRPLAFCGLLAGFGAVGVDVVLHDLAQPTEVLGVQLCGGLQHDPLDVLPLVGRGRRRKPGHHIDDGPGPLATDRTFGQRLTGVDQPATEGLGQLHGDRGLRRRHRQGTYQVGPRIDRTDIGGDPTGDDFTDQVQFHRLDLRPQPMHPAQQIHDL